jgi:hypothetical protein
VPIQTTPRSVGTDSQIVESARRLLESGQVDVATARANAFVWILILAMLENTIPSDVLDRARTSAPSKLDQRMLVGRLRQAVNG